MIMPPNVAVATDGVQTYLCPKIRHKAGGERSAPKCVICLKLTRMRGCGIKKFRNCSVSPRSSEGATADAIRPRSRTLVQYEDY